jgi:C4-dicarboxylate transporter DctQ subunit
VKVLDHIEEWIITFLIGAATLIIFVAVMHRYAAGLPIPGVQDWLLQINLTWAQELCIIMFVWMAKFGAAYGVQDRHSRWCRRADQHPVGTHAGQIHCLRHARPEPSSPASSARLARTFVWENGAHYGITNLLGIKVDGLYEGPTTPDLEWPTWIVYSAIPLGSSLMCFRFLQVTVSFIKTGELPHHDHGHVDGIEEGEVPVEVNPYNMDDDLHPHDLKFSKRHPDAKVGADGTATGDKGDAK